MPFNVQCKRCYHLYNDWCKQKLDSPDPDMTRNCLYYKEATNADRIRAMSDEELAEFIANMVDHDWCCDSGCMIKHAGMCGYAEKGCDESALNWLQSPAGGGDGE